MFAIVRTGGKQYRVAADQKIVVDRIAGDVGDSIALDDVLMMADGDSLKDAAKEVVHAEIVEQAKSKKIKVFKKRRRQGYRRTQGHRQQLTVLKITALGGKAPAKTAAPAKAADEKPADDAAAEPAAKKAAPAKKAAASKDAATETKAAPKTAAAEKKAPAKKAPAKKAAPKAEDK